MDQNYQKLFKYLKPNESAPGLLSVVMARLVVEERRAIMRSRRHLFFASILLLSSLVALVPVFKTVYSDLITSGFVQYLSLISSDFSTVTASWQNYIFSLLETLPVFSLTLFLGVIFIFLGALRFFTSDIRSIFRHSPA